MTNLTSEQLRTLRVLSEMLMKLLFALSSIVAFWIILSGLINNWFNDHLLTIGIVESLLGGTHFYIVKHYFPSKKSRAR
jgi:hypothetical protein